MTDANLVLGEFPESGLLGGTFALDVRRAGELHGPGARPVRSVEEFAQGIVDVANAVMEKAIRVISVERGHDPRDYTLVAFGGAGALARLRSWRRRWKFRACWCRAFRERFRRWAFCART